MELIVFHSEQLQISENHDVFRNDGNAVIGEVHLGYRHAFPPVLPLKW